MTATTRCETWVGLVGFAVTLGLFLYSLRGTQHADVLTDQGSSLETKMGLSVGQFKGRPREMTWLIGYTTASTLIYFVILVAWAYSISFVEGRLSVFLVAIATIPVILSLAHTKQLLRKQDLLRRAFEEVWNKGNLSAADLIFATDYIHHDPSTPDFGRGPESEKKRATLYRAAFPDLRLSVEEIIAEGDRVVARWTARGTHKSELRGLAPTGRLVTVSGVTFGRVSRGKLAEAWVNWDAQGLMEQLGVRAAGA